MKGDEVMGTVKISPGNSKMGSVPSVSLPAVITCRECDCHQKCYARKLERLRPAVRNAYRHNLEVLQNDPDTYWREVEAAIMLTRFFRFHVSGDIPDERYLDKMVEIAEHNQHCQILCFTKKYEIVNNHIADNWCIPDNLRIIFSAWDNLPVDNPYNLPVAYVRFKDGHTDAPENATNCGGNCSECASTDGGCWTLGVGEAVVFDEH